MSDTVREEEMATARQAEAAAPVIQDEIVNTVVDEEASVAPRRYFTIADRDPFEEIEWELRDAHIPGKDGPAFEQKDVEFPKFWSQTATNIVAVKANGLKEVFRVTLRNGSYVEATGDHLVKAVDVRRVEPSWVRVDQLRLGMRMHLHPHRARVEDRALVLAGVGSSLPDTPAGADSIEVAEAALAGWLQADGFVGQYEEGTNRSLTIEFQ